LANTRDQFQEKRIVAEALLAKGLFQQAEKAYQSLTQLYLQTKQDKLAADCLEKLINVAPKQPSYYETLAGLYAQMGESDKAISCYQRLLTQQPALAVAHYNLGYLQRQNGYFEDALASYENSLRHGIEQPEEVHLNLAVIYSDHLRKEDRAIAALEKALSINPKYISAMFNLANIHEEAGDRAAAEKLFQKIIDQDPFYYAALARLGDVKKFTDPHDPMIRRMKRAARKLTIDISTRTNLYFALGKALNDCEEYGEAFESYQEANECNKQTVTAYDRVAQERMINDLTTVFSKDWFEAIEPVSDAAPIFICGMFRSGSTLTEQILASHPKVTAGGEVDFFVREIKNRLTPYPASLMEIERDKLDGLARDYMNHLTKCFPDADYITDKRPDNFLHLGLLKSLFPKAKFIYTSRNPLDNCLSVYFLRLGNAMNYATDLQNTAHYYQQCETLMTHWKTLFGDNIFELKYDDLVTDPRPVIEDMLSFCGLEWRDECLNFHKLDNIVKTASVWQVREPLYQKSSGRWRNFEKQLGSISQLFDSQK